MFCAAHNETFLTVFPERRSKLRLSVVYHAETPMKHDSGLVRGDIGGGGSRVSKEAIGSMTAFTRQAGRRHVGLVQAFLFAFVLVAAGLTPTPGAEPLVAQSGENTRYAAIVVDAKSGEVLFARRADSPRYPASITKVMTLYLTFEALAEGRIKLDDMITVSPRAAAQPPSKLGLAAGQRITVDDAMQRAGGAVGQ